MSLAIKVEQQVKAYLLQQGIDEALKQAAGLDEPQEKADNIFLGIGFSEKEAPCIIVAAENGTELIEYTGVYDLPLTIEAKIKQIEDDLQTGPAGAFDDLVQALEDALQQEDIVDLLNATPGCTMTFQGIHGRSQTPSNVDDCNVIRFSLRVICCEADVR